MFIVDVSEIKQYLGCNRQWCLGSRNGYKLSSVKTSKALRIGTLFHLGLAHLYNQAKINRMPTTEILYSVHEKLDKDCSIVKWLLEQYLDGPMCLDYQIFEVLDVEWFFDYTIREFCGHLAPDGRFLGAIDVVVRDKETHTIWGLEHKTATYARVNNEELQNDLQCLVYYRALQLRFPKEQIGGIIINEVLKDKSEFQHQRIFITPTANQLIDVRTMLIEVLNQMVADVSAIKKNELDHNHESKTARPVGIARSHDMLTCRWCSFAALCKELQSELTNDLSDEVWEKYKELYYVRGTDHLENTKSN